MTATVKKIRNYISPRSLLGALALTVLLYLGLFGYVFLSSSSTLEKIQSRLDSKLVLLERSYETFEPVYSREQQEEEQKSDVAEPSSKASTTPFNLYKKPFPTTRKPLISLVVMDYGLSERASNALLNTLPNSTTLMLNPYSDSPEHWQDSARRKGFELWLDLPITSKNVLEKDNGPHSLQEDESLAVNDDNLEWLLSRIKAYAGVGASFSASMQHNIPILKSTLGQISSRGLGVFDTSLTSDDLFKEYAKENAIPPLSAPVNLHDVSLKDLEAQAKKNGYVIATMYPYPKTIEAIKIWEKTLALKGLALAPLSVITTRSTIEEEPKEEEIEPPKHVEEVPAIAPNTHTNHH